MKSILNEADNDEFIARIDKLTPDSPALWGKMNVSQMLAHSQILLEVVLGEVKLKRVFIGRIFGKIAKKNILLDAPIKRNLPTFKDAVIKDERNFNEEKEKLKALVKNLQHVGYEGMVKAPHPFFGNLSPREWDQLNTKHLDHHLKQFGV